MRETERALSDKHGTNNRAASVNFLPLQEVIIIEIIFRVHTNLAKPWFLVRDNTSFPRRRYFIVSEW